MGICFKQNTKSSVLRVDDYMNMNKIRIFGLKKMFNTVIKPNKKLDRKLKFEIRIFNVKAKILEENHVYKALKKYYFAKIVFFNTHSYFLPITSGSNPRFVFDKSVTIEIEFDEMEKNYMEFVIYPLILVSLQTS